jgi:hypothetical protein
LVQEEVAAVVEEAYYGRQGKARQGKARQGTARHGKARQGTARQIKNEKEKIRTKVEMVQIEAKRT